MTVRSQAAPRQAGAYGREHSGAEERTIGLGLQRAAMRGERASHFQQETFGIDRLFHVDGVEPLGLSLDDDIRMGGHHDGSEPRVERAAANNELEAVVRAE